MMQQESSPQPVRRLSYFHDALSLCTVDFPIFYIESISERHVVIAGGGGSSKTGVYNQINIVELSPSNGSCYAALVAKYKDIPDAIMTASLIRELPISKTRLVTGGQHPTIYQLSFDSVSKNLNIKTHETLKDSRVRSEIKCVKYAGGRICAGGIDGQLTIWDDKELTGEIKAHSKEIDEIDVDTVNEHVLTLSRGEGRLVLWNLSDLKHIKEYTNKDFNRTPGVTYCLRSCKYAFETSNKGIFPSLIVACNPIPAKNQPCLLSKMSVKSNELSVITNKLIAADGVMAMTISSDGKHVAIGTRSGGVAIFDVRNLAQIYYINNVHHNAVTDLAFLPPTQESLALTDSKMCPLLSVSIDRRLILHRPKGQSFPMKLLKYVLIMLVIYLIFFFTSKYTLN
uniref:Prolactin regulatory element-binding protein n=1 Tax=Aceria tosichella TaxID=561515 RepID=A0A6G1S8G3_9ACAR